MSEIDWLKMGKTNWTSGGGGRGRTVGRGPGEDGAKKNSKEMPGPSDRFESPAL